MVIINKLAGGETSNLRLVEFPVCMVLDLFDRSTGGREPGGLDQTFQFVVAPSVPFGIDQKRKSLFKVELLVGGWILELCNELGSHCRKFHLAKEFNGRLITHRHHPPSLRSMRHHV